MSEQTYRVAPKGFAPEQWQQFMTEGFLVIEKLTRSSERRRKSEEDQQ